MKSKWTIAGILSAGLLLALAVGFSQAQGPEPPENAVTGESLAASVPFGIPIQGRLTDASGNPISGSRVVTFTLYDSLDNQIWSSGPQALTMDNNGLFSTVIAFAEPSLIDGRELRLGIQVAGDSVMSPHQIIYAVPYAWSLRPGAIISDTQNSAVLNVYNFGAGPALYAGGNGRIRSTAATDWVVSPLKMVQEDSVNGNDLNIVPSTQFGYVKLYTDGQDDCLALLPVDVAAYLFGTRVKLSSFYFCYRMDNIDDKITQVDVDYVGTDGSAHNLCSYTPDVSSTTWACQTCTPAYAADIYGPVFVRFSLHFAGDGSNRGIRLGQMYLHLTE